MQKARRLARRHRWVTYFFTLYIQNSILQWVIGTFLKLYFRFILNGLQRFRRFCLLTSFFASLLSALIFQRAKKKARFSARLQGISFFFTLYIQNSILQWVIETFLKLYFRFVLNGLQRFCRFCLLTRFFLTSIFS
jgi:hypothetical protein